MTDTHTGPIVWKGNHIYVVRDGRWEYVDRCNATGGVVIIPVTDAGELVMVEQHRVPVGGPVIELPAGIVGDEPGLADEESLSAARRELVEETGYEATDVRFLVRGVPMPGLTSERLTFALATGLRKVGAGGGVEHENITVHTVPLHNVYRWLVEQQNTRGVTIDTKIFTGMYFVMTQCL
ncbi:MAG: NUDIX domain-containing protein [Phycisphaera sp.]|nr:NUDIX domain-containing protein [Phycisphaera sp.]